jgi:hypothetical protein
MANPRYLPLLAHYATDRNTSPEVRVVAQEAMEQLRLSLSPATV